MKGAYTVKHRDHQAWYLDGDYHREDGPAYLGNSGLQSWWLYGKRHRIDGPALIRSKDHKRPSLPNQEWWYHGQKSPATNQQEFDSWLKMRAFW
jgi:hypothetical protein